MRDVFWSGLFGLCVGVAVEAYQPSLGDALVFMWAMVGVVLVRICWRMP